VPVRHLFSKCRSWKEELPCTLQKLSARNEGVCYILGGIKPSSRPRKEINMLIQKKKRARWGTTTLVYFLHCLERNAIFHLLSFFLFLVFPLPSFPLSFWRIRNSHASISLAVMCPRGTGVTRGHPGLSCKGHIRPRAGLICLCLSQKIPEMTTTAAFTRHSGIASPCTDFSRLIRGSAY